MDVASILVRVKLVRATWLLMKLGGSDRASPWGHDRSSWYRPIFLPLPRVTHYLLFRAYVLSIVSFCWRISKICSAEPPLPNTSILCGQNDMGIYLCLGTVLILIYAMQFLSVVHAHQYQILHCCCFHEQIGIFVTAEMHNPRSVTTPIYHRYLRFTAIFLPLLTFSNRLICYSSSDLTKSVKPKLVRLH